MLNINKPSLLSFVLFLLAPSFVWAQYENPIPIDANVRIGKLPNGFTYYVRKNIEPKNRAVLYLATKVGSVLENDDQQGVAHFIEHMGFDGTTHYPKNELINYLQKAGVRFGADLNAYTSFDETVYQLPIPTDDPAIISNGIQIIRDWAQEATLDPADIEKERKVVLEEKRYRSGVNERINRQTFPLIYSNSRYGKRLAIGTEEVLTTIKPETLKQFYHDWYRPDLEAIIAVGDFDVDEMVQTIKNKFSDLKNPANERERPAYNISFINDHQYTAATDKEQLTTYAQILLKHHSPIVKTEADYIDRITEAIFNILIQNRFRDLKNQGNPDISAITAGIGVSAGRLALYKTTVTTSPDKLEFGLKAIWRETIKAAKYGYTHDEFTKARNIYYGSKLYTNEHRDKITSQNYVNQYLNNFLKGDPIPGEYEDLQLVKYLLPKISLLDVDQFGNQYLSSPNRDVIIVAPEKDKAKLPDMETVEKWLNDVMNENIAAPTDDDNNKSKALISKRPSKSKVISQKRIDEVNVTEVVLSNGLKVVLKPTEFGLNDIRFTCFGAGGTDVYNTNDRVSATSAAAIIKMGGVGQLSATELKQFLSTHPVIVNPYIDRYTQGISGSCMPHGLDAALQLINQYFTSPRKDSTAYYAYVDKLKAAAANRRNNRDSTLSNTITSKINIDRVYEIYKERFSNAADFTFVLVGNFDVKETLPLLERYLGSLPSNNTPTVIKIPAPVSRRSRTTYSGIEPKANVTMRFLGDYKYNSDNNTQFQALTEVMKIKLVERLRQQESGIYSTNVFYNIYTIPAERFVFTINFVCAPDNVDKLVAATLDEINKIKTTGPDAVNIDKYKSSNARLMETQLKSNPFWLNYLYQQYLNKADVSEVTHYKTMADKVTPESLKALATTYLTTGNYERQLTLPENARK